MFDFLKTVGQGILYLILSPFILAGVVLYAVYAVFLFFFMFGKRVVLFFKGENMKTAMRYDEVAAIHLKQQDNKKEEAAAAPVQQNTTVNNNTTIERTTLVQPIIIQTDEEGRLKNVQYMNAGPINPQTSPQNTAAKPADEPLENEKPLLEDNGDVSPDLSSVAGNKEEEQA